LDANEWRDFRFEFQVPEACTLQEIRLVSAEKHPHEHSITGDAWFDRMDIRQTPAKARPTEPKVVE